MVDIAKAGIVGASRPSSNQSDRTQADELAALTQHLARTDRHRIARATEVVIGSRR